ncbi:MAG: hypothetical protein K1X78_27200 [Verrucomicrobiaceae bacterium]|nr:hypothetical protein [Verrucomicrobiaceae bacterium]
MKIVVCEGQDDQAVIKGLCDFAGIADIAVEHCAGRTNLERFLSEMPKRPEFTRGEVESVAVIIDAEEEAAGSWQKIVNAVKQSFQITLVKAGDFSTGSPKIGGYIVGRDGGKGMIEDLCLEAVSEQPGYACLLDYFKCLAEKTGRTDHLAKARFRAWMASQSDFDLRVGKAAEKGHLPWGNKAFDPLRAFLRKL